MTALPATNMDTRSPLMGDGIIESRRSSLSECLHTLMSYLMKFTHLDAEAKLKCISRTDNRFGFA